MTDTATCMAGCGRERPVESLVLRRDRDAQPPAPTVRVCEVCAERGRYVERGSEEREQQIVQRPTVTIDQRAATDGG
jgi:hypothetical protein